MQKLIVIALLILNRTALGADGPQNSGTLTIESSTAPVLSAQLQIDRKVLTQIGGESEQVTESTLQKIFTVQNESSSCPINIKSQLASPEVVSAQLEITCQSKPLVAEVGVVQPAALPENFSLGVRTASGHYSLDRAMPSVQVIVNLTYLYFRSGLGFMGFSDLPDQIMLNRQAALWWGGAHRLPPAFGYLLLLILIALASISLRQKIWITGASIFLLICPAFLILNSGSAQVVHSLLYVSHSYYLTVATLAWVCSQGDNRKLHAVSLFLILTAFLIYGVELSTMLWPLEKPEVLDRLSPIVGFTMGLNIVSWGVVVVLAALVKLLDKNRRKREFWNHTTIQASGVYAVMICAIYLLVSAFVRVRI